MAYTNLGDAEKAVNAVQAEVKTVRDDLVSIIGKVNELQSDGLREVKEQLAVLAKPKVEAVEVTPSLALADVKSVVTETVEVWRLLEQSAARLVSLGILYERKDCPECGLYSVRFFRLQASEAPSS